MSLYGGKQGGGGIRDWKEEEAEVVQLLDEGRLHAKK